MVAYSESVAIDATQKTGTRTSNYVQFIKFTILNLVLITMDSSEATYATKCRPIRERAQSISSLIVLSIIVLSIVDLISIWLQTPDLQPYQQYRPLQFRSLSHPSTLQTSQFH